MYENIFSVPRFHLRPRPKKQAKRKREETRVFPTTYMLEFNKHSEEAQHRCCFISSFTRFNSRGSIALICLQTSSYDWLHGWRARATQHTPSNNNKSEIASGTVTVMSEIFSCQLLKEKHKKSATARSEKFIFCERTVKKSWNYKVFMMERSGLFVAEA